jgi:hypothetical protein
VSDSINGLAHNGTQELSPAHPCLLQHYSQYLSYRNSQDAPLPMNG